MPARHLDIKALTSQETWPLRQRILRPHQTLAEMAWPLDDATGAAHFGATLDGRLVGIASVIPEPTPDGEPAMRLRGMAVAPEARSRGVGAALLERCLEHINAARARVVWCNARLGAEPFYLRAGFVRMRPDPFELPGIGKHVAMRLAVPQGSLRPTYPRFHVAFPVTDLTEARRFYGGLLGCPEGRSASEWVDFDFYGHQIVAHKVPPGAVSRSEPTNVVDGKDVPVRHFGVVLTMPEWEAAAAHLRSVGVRFLIEPGVRFRGEPGEQATMFFLDPFGNALELKAFRDLGRLFAK